MADKVGMQTLAKDTAIYGLSSIIGKFLNWLLVPLYTYVLRDQADYGIVTNLYAWTALLLVILTYGMETGFFRFANKEGENATQVYGTSMISLLVTSSLFIALCAIGLTPIARVLGYVEQREFIMMLAICVAIDAFASIPFAYLRYEKRALRFASIKLLFVILNIFFNIFFLVICPKLTDYTIISSWYQGDYGVGYVFVSNLLATSIQTLCLLPTIVEPFKHKQVLANCFSYPLLKRILHYSLPLLVLGIAGIMNQTLDRILFPFLHPAIISSDPTATADAVQAELGIYGACFKVAMVMMMFTQAFRYAYEPFVFSKNKDRQSLQTYADVMKYYIIFSLLIWLGMQVYMDLLKLIIAPSYWSGLKVVPIVLLTYIFQGIYFNLSFWYKLLDKTAYGAYFSLLGLLITIVLQITLVPHWGYYASAASGTVCYFVIMLVSYFVGKRYLDVPYDFRRIGSYLLLTICLLVAHSLFSYWVTTPAWRMLWGTGLIVLFIGVLIKKDLPVSSLPVIGKYFRK